MRKSRHSLLLFLISLAVLPSAYTQTALQYVPITPCRLLDTRNGGVPLMGGQTLTVQIPQQVCPDLPAAQAYSFNVAVVPHQPLDFLTVYPAGEQPRPTVATLNSYDGRIKTVAAIVPAGADGNLSVYSTNTTDLILDFNGYFVAPGSNDSALAYYPKAPCRVLDTRGGQYIHANQMVNFTIAGTGGCIPSSGAQVFSLNFAAIPRTGYLDYMVAWQGGLMPMPMTATINAPTGAITADAALVQSGTGAHSGQISVFSTDDIDLVIDANGYFAPPGAAGQLLLYPSTPPCRALDTRPNYFQGQKTVQMESSACHVPAAAQAYIANATVIPHPELGYLTLWAHGQPPPNVSTLNAVDGAVTNNLAIVPAYTSNGTFLAYAPNSTQLIVDVFGFMAPPVTITTTSLPEGSEGQSYSAQLAASGGLPPYTWSITNGSLPPGLTLATSGAISGTPTTSGLFSFTVQAADSSSNTASAPLSLAVSNGRLMITTTQLPGGTQTVPYRATLGVMGGVPPYTWSIASGSLPSGLTLNSSSGVISGTPQSGGASNFTVEATDAIREDATAQLQITVHASVTNSALSGRYVFGLNGYQNGAPFVMAGDIVADGHGNITAGVLDLNSGAAPVIDLPFTGTYSISGVGVGTMSLTAGSLGTLNFHIALAAHGQSQIIWDDADPNPRGSGILLLQTATAFYPPAGNYAIGTLGSDYQQDRFASAGALTFATGGAVSGSEDMNDNGTLTTMETLSGQFLAVSSRTERGTASLHFQSGVAADYAYYIVNPQGEVLIVGTDPLSSHTPLTLGTILPQQGSGFTNSSLQGASILATSALAPNNGHPVADVVLGLANWNGTGSGNFSLDENRGGTISQQHTSQGTYTVAASGRTVLSGFGGTPPILYLVSPDQAFILGQDTSVAFGMLQPQSGAPYNNLSIIGTYLGGTTAPAQSAIVDSVGYLFADGNGNLIGKANTSGPSGTGTQNYSATYQVSSTGRAVLSGTPAGFMYVVSSGNVVFLPRGNTPALNLFSAGLTN